MSEQQQQQMVDRPLRSVFIGNIPYEVTEEKLKEIFSEVGPVISMKLVFDRETGKPKGYGFCEYKDIETAMSAMRNLNGYEINGRVLRVDNAGAERHRMADLFTQNMQNGPRQHENHHEPYHGGFERVQKREFDGPPLPEKTPEVISKAVASLPPEQMFELMKQMKVCIQNNPHEARTMLIQNPQLAYALLQAQVVMKIIEPPAAVAMLRKDNGIPLGSLLPEGQTGSMDTFGGVQQPENPWIAAAGGSGAPLMPLNPPGPFGPGPSMGMGPSVSQSQAGDMDFRQMDPRRNPSGPPIDMDLRDPRTQAQDRFALDPRQRDRDMRGDRDLRSDRDLRGDRDLRSDRPTRDSDLRDRDLRDPRLQPSSSIPSDPRTRARGEPPKPSPSIAGMAGFASGASDSEKAALIMQVLQLSDDQIAMLPPEQRQSILVLKEQIAKSTGQGR